MRMNVTTKVKRYLFSYSVLKIMPNKLNEAESSLDSYAYYIKSTTMYVFENNSSEFAKTSVYVTTRQQYNP